MRKLELLAPAKNLECGKAAIDHGADAVYIGALRFGARAAAGNSIDDIRQLCDYAHLFGAKVYVTVNTILYDEELEATEHLIWELYNIHVDAILVQDMALLRMKLPPIALHASTQTDNRTSAKVRFLSQLGMERVVLARELSVDEIATIHHDNPEVDLEVFVHGALCVSYSGQCYASHHCFGRSANRGECAQFCRLPFTLHDGEGRVVEADRHLLSLRDMMQLDNLGRLAEAGAVSFKIEGRLKDVDYVKNIVASYSERLNDVISKHNKTHNDAWQRASYGRCSYTFSPSVEKSFNRGFTTYFADGRRGDMVSFDTPKALGEFVGKVKEVRFSRRGEGAPSFNVAGTAVFSNGDGLCFFDQDRQLVGFRVNKVEGNRLYPHQIPHELKAGTPLFRNYDHSFSTLLSHKSSERRLWIDIRLDDMRLSATDEMGRNVSLDIAIEKQYAQKPQAENIRKQLSKMGNTIFCVREISVADDYPYFIPSSVLAELRRNLVEALLSQPSVDDRHERIEPEQDVKPLDAPLPYLLNASNHLSRQFYSDLGIIADSFERQKNSLAERPLLMQCRYCLRHAMGACLKEGGNERLPEPLTLSLRDGKCFSLTFNCKKCEMYIHADK